MFKKKGKQKCCVSDRKPGFEKVVRANFKVMKDFADINKSLTMDVKGLKPKKVNDR